MGGRRANRGYGGERPSIERLAMDLELSKRSAVVLASSGGLGRAVAEALLAEGARVALSGRDEARLAATVRELAQEHGDRVFGEAFDIADRGALARHLESARAHNGAVDVLVTNCGGPPPGGSLAVTHEGLDRAFDLITHSAVHAVQTVLPWMRARGWGRILALTSLTVRHPHPGLAYSNIARAGLTAYLKTLADEVGGDGVLVNTVCTGMFGTERLDELFATRAAAAGTSVDEERAKAVASIPVGRVGTPREFGDLCAFLVSGRNTFVHGTNLPIDGGAGRFLL
ncbi:MAG: SDR family oxidoreductase [Planctomycetota bacterium]